MITTRRTGFVWLHPAKAHLERCLLRLPYSLIAALWLTSVSLYIHTRFYADLIFVVLPGNHCLLLEFNTGQEQALRIDWESNWTGPKLFVWRIGERNRLEDGDYTHGPYSRFADTVEAPAPVVYEWPKTWNNNFYYGRWATYFPYVTKDGPSINGPLQGEEEVQDGPPEDPRLAVSHLVLKVKGVGMPDWAAPLSLTLLMLVLLAPMAFRARRRSKRQRKGQCLDCGYDLRATPERCPECNWSKPIIPRRRYVVRIEIVIFAITAIGLALGFRWLAFDYGT